MSPNLHRAVRRHDVRGAITMLLGGATMLAGCADPKAANEANFREVLAPLVRDVFCDTIRADRMALTDADEVPAFPIIVPAAPIEAWDDADKQARAMLELAARDGLLTRRETSEPARRLDYTLPLERQALIAYTPTTKGAAFFREIAGKRHRYPALCAATGEIAEVVRWTDPADMFGQTVTRVTYTYRGIDPMPQAPEEMRTKMARPKERTTTLVRASDGWHTM